MTILAAAYASIEVDAPDGSKSAVALSRIDVDSDGSPVDPRTALSSIEVVSNAPLGLSASGDRVSADMEVVSDGDVVGFIGKVASSGAEVVLSPEGPAWSMEVPG